MTLKINRRLHAIPLCIAICAPIAAFAQKGPSPETVEAQKAKRLQDEATRRLKQGWLAGEEGPLFERCSTLIARESNRRKRVHRDAGGQGLPPPVTDPKGPFLGDEAFEKRVWAELSEHVVKAREKRNLVDAIRARNDRLTELAQDTEMASKLREEQREALNLEIAALKKALVPVEHAEGEAGMLVSAIAGLRDAKGMRLIAPIAFESDIWSEWYGDYGASSFVSRVLHRLQECMQFGAITEKVPFSEGTSKEATAIPWRKWFEANKEKYGLIYQLPPVGAKPELAPPKPAAPAPEPAPLPPSASNSSDKAD